MRKDVTQIGTEVSIKRGEGRKLSAPELSTQKVRIKDIQPKC